ncbi:hypothetical protein [Thalassoglobus polymorphus]|uniref:Uncharacterized protein n=1 Tax=Thalassoglobus polymorphus TaxID=2527994 RepID=A0A517QU93_9PLAN|nr:hypothetical protein [Thalassoglobus polymorphus]QDT35212.1 hypothetical protein Mal48_44880 [Thalassoglobus polymorphus]
MSDYLTSQNFPKAVAEHTCKCSRTVLVLLVLVFIVLSQAASAEDTIRTDQQKSLQEITGQITKLSRKTLATLEAEGVTRESLAAQKKLIEALEQFVSQSAGKQSSASQTPMNSDGKGDSGKTAGNSEQAGNAGMAPRDDQNQSAGAEDIKVPSNLVDSVWGHLPEQERNDLLRTYSESYLPGYEERVRRYFEQLAKLRRRDQAEKPALPRN